MENLPQQGEFVVIWKYGNTLHPNLFRWYNTMSPGKARLYGWNEQLEHWEEATEENGWFFEDMDKTLVITKDSFIN